MQRKRKIAGLIAAAGLSSRMDAFKPLLPLGRTTVIEHTVHSLKNAGVEDVRAVVGHRGDEVAAKLNALGVPSIENARYADTGMFESVAMGLEWLAGDADAFFLLPGDIPLVKRHSIKAMTKAFLNTDAPLVYPVCRGKRGHPPLIAKECFPAILAHDGSDGLRGALKQFGHAAIEIDLPDPGLLMDADTRDDYALLRDCEKNAFTPSADVCATILAWAGTPAETVAHSRAVARIAALLARLLQDEGHRVDNRLAFAGGLLHDIAKGRPNHTLRGARLLFSLGYPETARVVHAHNDLPSDAVNAIDERALVFLADKLVLGTSAVGINARFKRALDRFAHDEGIVENIRQRKDTALCVAQKIAALLGKKSFDEIERML